MKKGSSFSACLGRGLLGLSFVALGIIFLVEWANNLTLLQAHHINAPTIILGVMIAVAIIAGIFLTFGLLPYLATVLLILLTITLNIVFYNFWSIIGSNEVIALTQFVSNIAIIGGLIAAAKATNS